MLEIQTAKQERERERETWEVPRLALVDVDDGDGVEAEGLSEDLAPEVEPHEFLVGGMESKPWSQRRS